MLLWWIWVLTMINLSTASRNLRAGSSLESQASRSVVGPMADKNVGTSIQLCGVTYTLLKALSSGAQGTVYKAKAGKKLVAIKIMKKDNPKNIFFIQHELEAVREIEKRRHKHVVHYYCDLETDSEAYIVMEYCNGDLFDLMDKFEGTLLEPDVVRVAKQLAEALHDLHSMHLLHGDIKLENILVCRNGVFKISDFGFAQHLKDNEKTLKFIGGSPGYAAPELIDPSFTRAGYGPKVDLYAFGIVLLRLLTDDNHIPYPENPVPNTVDPKLRDLINGLLIKNQESRLTFKEFFKRVKKVENT